MQDHSVQTSRPSLGLLAVSLAAVLALSSFMMFWRLGATPLANWDEGIHAEVTREMSHDGAWISMSYRDQYYTAKPPLRFWLTAALFPVLGENEFSLRFWSATAGVATALLLTFWIWQMSNSMRLAFLAGALFTLGRFTLFHAFRTGETDGLFVLLFTAALYCYWRSREKPRWFIGFGALVGLAVMTKSFAGLIPPLIVAIDLTVSKKWSQIGFPIALSGVGAAAAIALPWHVAEFVRHGSTFWNSYFGFHVLERSSEVLYANNVAWYWYAEVLFKRTFPFSVFVPLAALLALRRIVRLRDAFDRFLVIWIGVVFVLFSFVQTKFDWYILPLYPALVMVLARGFTEFLHQKSDRLLVWAALASFLSGVALLPQGIAHEGLLWKLTPFAYLPAWYTVTVGGQLIVAAATTAIVMVITILLKRQTIIEPTRIVGMIVIGYLVAMSFGWQYSYIKHLPSTSPLKDVANELRRVKATELDVVGINLTVQPAGYYYLRSVPDLKLYELKSVDDLGSSHALVQAGTPQYDSAMVRGSAILIRDRFALVFTPTMQQ